MPKALVDVPVLEEVREGVIECVIVWCERMEAVGVWVPVPLAVWVCGAVREADCVTLLVMLTVSVGDGVLRCGRLKVTVMAVSSQSKCCKNSL